MKSILKLTGFLIVLVAIVAIVGRLFFFDIGKTANYSMIPNIIPGDIFLFRTVGLLGTGDIAVCKNPEDPSTLVVGRIIGVPDDSIRIKHNHVIKNSKMIQHNAVNPIIYFDTTTEEELKYIVQVVEEKTGGSLYEAALMDVSRGKRYEEVVVPPNHFFLLGDNRNMAYDSRNFGMVPIENCLGGAFFILWAAPTNGDLKQSQRSFSWI